MTFGTTLVQIYRRFRGTCHPHHHFVSEDQVTVLLTVTVGQVATENFEACSVC